MQQYLDLLKSIKERGVHKPAARANMPGTTSLFGYQFRHNLADGFPLLTTKKMFWKGVVVELLWFLRGDNNIKYLVDNGVNIWNEDAYQYYLKVVKQNNDTTHPVPFDDFIHVIKHTEYQNFELLDAYNYTGYKLGDCGYQYGKVWRNGFENFVYDKYDRENKSTFRVEEVVVIDQIKNLIEGLRKNPEGRRHLVTAVDPAHQDDLALYWCHCLMQFNCRPLTLNERYDLFMADFNLPHFEIPPHEWVNEEWGNNYQMQHFDKCNIPKYCLDCQLYQRSADVVLGVPFNIASYALLTHILAEMCNMVPGEFIHTFGDVHIYDNHKDAVEVQLSREPRQLPKLKKFGKNWDFEMERKSDDKEFFNGLFPSDFTLDDYNPHPAISAELSTGLKK